MTTPYVTWNLINKHIGATQWRHLHLKLKQQSLDRAKEIGSIGLELATPMLGLESFLTSNASTCCHGPWRRPSGLPQDILHFTSLSFFLLIFGFCCGVWTVLFWERERERESSFSFWTDSLSLSLYNYSIYLPLCFFTLSVGVSLCWSNDGNDWEISKSILGKRRNQEKLKLEQTCKKRWDFRFEKLKLEQRCKKQWDFRFLFIFG